MEFKDDHGYVQLDKKKILGINDAENDISFTFKSNTRSAMLLYSVDIDTEVSVLIIELKRHNDCLHSYLSHGHSMSFVLSFF